MKVLHRLAVVVTLAAVPVAGLNAQEETPGNQIDEIARDMKVASDHLSKKTTNKPTQTAQEAAISKLDALIAELEEKRRQNGGGLTGKPTIPAMSSTIRQGPGGMGDLHGTRTDGDRWGELPAHERDRILQSLTEGFPPHYQAVLEAYYKRLAVEKRAEEPDAATAPKSTSTPKAMMEQKTPVKAGAPMMKPDSAKMATPAKKTEK